MHTLIYVLHNTLYLVQTLLDMCSVTLCTHIVYVCRTTKIFVRALSYVLHNTLHLVHTLLVMCSVTLCTHIIYVCRTTMSFVHTLSYVLSKSAIYANVSTMIRATAALSSESFLLQYRRIVL